ncbi:MAG: response regulator [Planctomycetota bacterium]|jgi:signal transduction histidine kinase/CheY-like chemotaxis protein
MILRTEDATGLLRVSPSFSEILGLDEESLQKEPLIEWIHPEDRSRFAALDEDGAPVHARHRDREGNWHLFRWRAKRHDDTLAFLGWLQTESEARDEPEQTLAPQFRASLSETLEAMAKIVEKKNPGLRCSILLMDEAHDRVTVGAGPSLPPDYNAAVEGLRIGPGVGSCGTAAFWNEPVVVENIQQDPLWRELQDAASLAGVSACWSQPITGTEGKVLGAMALYDRKPNRPSRSQMDGLEVAAHMVGLAIERDRLEEELRQSLKMEAIGVLAGGVAHDFNNLLATVLGNAELALGRLPEESEVTRMLREIVTASVTATGLCNQMLAYAGRGSLAKEVLDCSALVKELTGLLQVTIPKKTRLEFDLHASQLGILADRSQIGQVIMNLITNASDAIGSNEGRIIVGTRAQQLTAQELAQSFPEENLSAGEYACIWVSDTGKGMSRETRSKIFDPFFTTKPSGRGLGLATVQGIVKAHNGAIRVESTPDHGTTFSILLPRAPLEGDGQNPEQDKREQQPAHILVVDDESTVRRVHKDILESAGYQVTCACDGPEAIELFRKEWQSIDCVILDLSMPKMDGDEVFSELRKIRRDVIVILSSGFAEQEVMDRFEGLGLAGFLHKPTRMHVLLAKIGEALSQARV